MKKTKISIIHDDYNNTCVDFGTADGFEDVEVTQSQLLKLRVLRKASLTFVSMLTKLEEKQQSKNRPEPEPICGARVRPNHPGLLCGLKPGHPGKHKVD